MGQLLRYVHTSSLEEDDSLGIKKDSCTISVSYAQTKVERVEMQQENGHYDHCHI